MRQRDKPNLSHLRHGQNVVTSMAAAVGNPATANARSYSRLMARQPRPQSFLVDAMLALFAGKRNVPSKYLLSPLF